MYDFFYTSGTAPGGITAGLGIPAYRLNNVKGKTYQVALDEEKENSIIFILPQLFDDHIVKILSDELSISFPKIKPKNN